MGSLNIGASQEESPDFLQGKLQAKMEAIQRLQAVGLTNEQITKCLDMTLEEIRQVDLKEEKIEQGLMADGFPGSSLDRSSDIQFWQLAHPGKLRNTRYSS